MVRTLASLADDREHRFDDLFDGTIIRIDDNRILSRTHRGNSSRRIAAITVSQFRDDLLQRAHDSPSRQVTLSPSRPLFQRCVQPNLHRGFRHDHGADIPASDDDAPVARQLPLQAEESPPDRRMGRNQGSEPIDLWGSDRPGHIAAVEPDVIEPPILDRRWTDPNRQVLCQLRQSVRIIRCDSPLQRQQGEHPIDNPSVEVQCTESFGDFSADGALS